MKFACTQENLIQGLTIVSHITGKSLNLPILGNVLLKTENGNMKLFATNLELAVSTMIRGKVEEDGEYTVPAKLFMDFVSLLPQGKVDLELIEEGLRVTAAGQETVIRGMPAQEFPLIPRIAKVNGVKFKAADLRKMIGQIAFSASTSESRPEISGIACFFGGSLGASTAAFVATDSYRLAERTLTGISGASEARMIVPARTMLELSRILGSTKDELGVPEEIEWQTSENQLVVTYGNTELISRLIEGAFPDYLQIIPERFGMTVTVDRNDLQKAVKSASLFARQGLYDVHLCVKFSEGTLEVSSADQGTGKTASSLPVEISGGESDVLLTVNFRYVTDGLGAISAPKVRMLINDAMSPMLIVPPEGDEEKYRYLVMPIRQ